MSYRLETPTITGVRKAAKEKDEPFDNDLHFCKGDGNDNIQQFKPSHSEKKKKKSSGHTWSFIGSNHMHITAEATGYICA